MFDIVENVKILRPKLHIEYQNYIKWLMLGLTIMGVLMSFIALNIYLAVPFALIGALVPWVCSKIIYSVPILWIMPMTTVETFSNQLGVFLFEEDWRKNEVVPGLGLIYENKYAAKESYSVLRSWNYGCYIDKKKNICVSMVDEGDNCYTVFVYPGLRPASRSVVETEAKKYYEDVKIEPEVRTVHLWHATPIDARNDPKKKAVIKKIENGSILLLNTFYATKSGIKKYAKKTIVLKSVKYSLRSNLPVNSIEYHQKWYDGKIKYPDTAKRCKELEVLTKQSGGLD